MTQEANGTEPPATREADPLSKNQQKKLRRQQEWEAGRAARKAKEKEKRKARKQQKRAALSQNTTATATPAQSTSSIQHRHAHIPRRRPVLLPITILIDCGFDSLMTDKERKSLAAQITRAYSENYKSQFRARLAVSSFDGHLKDRFEGILAGQYQAWKNVTFSEGDFVQVATECVQAIPDDAPLAGNFTHHKEPTEQRERLREEGEVVYLSSDSPNTLHELKPFSTYIVGGLVDRNRFKGMCYRRAMDRGLKTAKLPIGEFMRMNSRFVLATSHVIEIMLKWLEYGDWGKSFVEVLPKRKGGELRDLDAEGEGPEGQAEERDDGESEDDGDGRDDHDGKEDSAALPDN